MSATVTTLYRQHCLKMPLNIGRGQTNGHTRCCSLPKTGISQEDQLTRREVEKRVWRRREKKYNRQETHLDPLNSHKRIRKHIITCYCCPAQIQILNFLIFKQFFFKHMTFLHFMFVFLRRTIFSRCVSFIAFQYFFCYYYYLLLTAKVKTSYFDVPCCAV